MNNETQEEIKDFIFNDKLIAKYIYDEDMDILFLKVMVDVFNDMAETEEMCAKGIQYIQQNNRNKWLTVEIN